MKRVKPLSAVVPLMAPDDAGEVAEPLLARVVETLSKSDVRLLAFMRRAVRVEVGEGLVPVLSVRDADIPFEPLNILWMIHFGLLSVGVDASERVYLVATDDGAYVLEHL